MNNDELDWRTLVSLLRSAAKRGERATIEIDGEDCAFLLAHIETEESHD